MKLPLLKKAFVQQAKVTDYLLSSTHPGGQAKARFFLGLGFQPAQWTLLADALCRVETTNEVFSSVESAHGTRYTVDGFLEAPDGRSPKVRTVWIIETNCVGPRLVTAYPVEIRA